MTAYEKIERHIARVKHAIEIIFSIILILGIMLEDISFFAKVVEIVFVLTLVYCTLEWIFNIIQSIEMGIVGIFCKIFCRPRSIDYFIRQAAKEDINRIIIRS